MQNICQATLELDSTLNQSDVTEFYRSLHPTAANHPFFSSSQGSRIIRYLLLEHSETELEVRNRRMSGRSNKLGEETAHLSITHESKVISH